MFREGILGNLRKGASLERDFYLQKFINETVVQKHSGHLHHHFERGLHLQVGQDLSLQTLIHYC